jgi:hypothetical protein
MVLTYKMCMACNGGAMVGATSNINSSKSAKMTLVRVLNNLDISHRVMNTFQFLHMNPIIISSNLLTLNMSNELVATIAITNAYCFDLSMSTNMSCIIS